MTTQVKTPTAEQFESENGSKSPSRALNLQTKRIASNDVHRLAGISKRRRSNAKGETKIRQLPSSFFKGGSINDPLNLIGIENRTVRTPQPSPRTIDQWQPINPIKRISNLADPLNLNTSDGDGDNSSALSPTGPHRKRKRLSKKTLQKLEIDFHSDDETPNETSENTIDVSNNLAEIKASLQLTSDKSIKEHKEDTGHHKISTSDTGAKHSVDVKAALHIEVAALPKVPRSQKSPYSQKSPQKSTQSNAACKVPKHKGKNGKFVYGNYNQYYGYRSTEKMELDPRILALKPSWFADKEVLDIGCNIGHVTLCVARDYSPKKVIGLDVDKKLIQIAKKNIQYYYDSSKGYEFPLSFPTQYGPLSTPELNSTSNKFPNNVSFVHSNYCLESDLLLEMVKPEFDIILALSITKWIHLNYGDSGLKRCFKRMFRQLRPGGLLVLEPQMWPSYKKKKNLTPSIRKNFDSITLKPDQFNEYLLSEVGFSTCERLNVHQHQSKGFRRPLFVFLKKDDTG